MSLWLDDDELYMLTGYRQRAKQRKALLELGVQFRTRPADGFLLVARSQFETIARGRESRVPNFAAAGS